MGAVQDLCPQIAFFILIHHTLTLGKNVNVIIYTRVSTAKARTTLPMHRLDTTRPRRQFRRYLRQFQFVQGLRSRSRRRLGGAQVVEYAEAEEGLEELREKTAAKFQSDGDGAKKKAKHA